jgi:hypothetical protein
VSACATWRSRSSRSCASSRSSTRGERFGFSGFTSKPDNGQITVRESWSGLNSCLHFWHDFVGSQIPESGSSCGIAAHEGYHLGASGGETFSRACKCGKIKKITTAAHLPPMK